LELKETGMTRYSAPQSKKKKRGTRAFLPILGLILAVLFAVVAYFAAPPVVDGLEGRDQKIATQFDDFRAKYGENVIDYIFAGLIWLFLLGLGVYLVSATIGDDPEKEAFKYMGPPPADKKAMVKAYKRELKERQKRAKQRQAQLKKK
jgi:amino acid transporter